MFRNNMDCRKFPLNNNNVYHILNKSIEGFTVFNDDFDYCRMLEVIRYYRFAETPFKYSQLLKQSSIEQEEIWNYFNNKNQKLVEIIAYCLMPTHYHLILKQLTEDGISKFISQIQNSYAKYFNTRINRKGPLWQGKFKNVLVERDEQLLHLTRYIHLNPVSAGIVNNPTVWSASSYREYLNQNNKFNICNYQDLINIRPEIYRRFVNNRVNYQRELSRIKKLILE